MKDRPCSLTIAKDDSRTPGFPRWAAKRNVGVKKRADGQCLTIEKRRASRRLLEGSHHGIRACLHWLRTREPFQLVLNLLRTSRCNADGSPRLGRPAALRQADAQPSHEWQAPGSLSCD